MTIKNNDLSIPRLLYCPNCRRRPMEIKKVGLGKRDGSIVHYVCSKCGQSRTESTSAANVTGSISDAT